MQLDQLRALLAVVDAGTFDAAARHLMVTPSAVSQRIKALEGNVGRVLVRRETPVAPTEAGERVLRLARQVVTLETQTRRELGVDDVPTVLPVAVNADSLATWMRELLPVAAAWEDITLQLFADDQEHTISMLRTGRVLAAITSSPEPIAGCRSRPLGRMRYLPVATAALAERFRRGRSYHWHRLPMLSYNAVDGLQAEFLAERDPAAQPPVTLIPDSTVYAEAIHAGLGWGMLPEAHLGHAIENGHLVRLHASHRDVQLYWQSWRLQSEPLARLTNAVRAAAEVLR